MTKRSIAVMIGVTALATLLTACQPSNMLGSDQRLNSGQSMASPNGEYVLRMQTDGNLVLIAPGNKPVWSTHTSGNGGAIAIMQGDGNLVVVAPGNRVVWASYTAGNPGAVLVVQDDGNVVIVAPGNRPVWDRINDGKTDVVSIGHQIQRMGFHVSEHPQFGGVCSGCHSSNSWHYVGKAIDVNWPGGGAEEAVRLDELEAWILKRVPQPTELLWRESGHYDHLHLAIA